MYVRQDGMGRDDTRQDVLRWGSATKVFDEQDTRQQSKMDDEVRRHDTSMRKMSKVRYSDDEGQQNEKTGSKKARAR